MTGSDTRGRPETIQGIPASPGVAVGPAFVFGDILDEIETREIGEAEVASEIGRFHEAVALVRDELGRDAERISKELSEEQADVFLVHSMILEDRMVLESIEQRIRRDRVNAEAAVADEMKKLAQVLARSDDAYLKDRAFDITDIGKRVIERILGVWAHCPLAHPMVVVARELRASDTVTMDRERILGFVTELGGKQTHAAILARSLGVPAIVGAAGVLDSVRTGEVLAVDGAAGSVIVGPDRETVEFYSERRQERERERVELGSLVDVPAETADGVRVTLEANIASVEDARAAARLNADGIGLFRTELVFMAAHSFLGGDEQYEIYRAVAEVMPGKPVTIRTLDVGGDKFVGPENPLREHNPYLGYRSTRALLDRPEILMVQMKAILRASVHGRVRMLLPMISNVEELRSVKAIFEEAKAGLRADRVSFREDVPVGVMIEIPSAAIVADRLAAECDFLSIGTNDLIQYALAVDRGNVYVDHLYRPHDPAVLSLIASAVNGADLAKKPIALCGEMGGTPAYVPLLIGLGLRDLSVATSRLLPAKKAIREADTREAASLAARALASSAAGDVAVLLGLPSGGRRHHS
jgi:phosphotransferase system enzyme I (PtsI)